MVPFDYKRFINGLTTAVENGDVPMSRIDDAVRRILQVKEEMGLFEAPLQDDSRLELVGCAAHRQLACEAIHKSAVLLKNENKLLPLAKETASLFVAGQAANDIGLCCGGWTINWLGGEGAITPGTTILQGIQESVSAETTVHYAVDGTFDQPGKAEVGIVVLHEYLYAEGMGDRADMSLPEADVQLLDRVAAQCEKVVVILISGRPLLISEQLDKAESWVAGWWPGSESAALAQLLFGDVPFSGKLSYTWPRTAADLPQAAQTGTAVLFPFGHGL
jgi:beta-glucosidase